MPEQSTAAIIVHHPEAKYYAVRGEGVAEGSSLAAAKTAGRAGDTTSGTTGAAA